MSAEETSSESEHTARSRGNHNTNYFINTPVNCDFKNAKFQEPESITRNVGSQDVTKATLERALMPRALASEGMQNVQVPAQLLSRTRRMFTIWQFQPFPVTSNVWREIYEDVNMA